MGERVRLRAVTSDDAELLERWRSLEYTGEFNDFDVQRGSEKERLLMHSMSNLQGGTLVVEEAQKRTPVGTVSWREVNYGPPPDSAAWNIGINLVPEARGRGFGSEAQRLLADHLFATTAANRIEAMTDVENLPEQRALEKAGFTREGVLRSAQRRRGALHDLVVYSRIRSEA